MDFTRLCRSDLIGISKTEAAQLLSEKYGDTESNWLNHINHLPNLVVRCGATLATIRLAVLRKLEREWVKANGFQPTLAVGDSVIVDYRSSAEDATIIEVDAGLAIYRVKLDNADKLVSLPYESVRPR